LVADTLGFSAGYSNNNTMSFYGNLDKPICQTIMEFAAARDDGSGRDNLQNSSRHTKFQSNQHHQHTNTQCFLQAGSLAVTQPKADRV